MKTIIRIFSLVAMTTMVQAQVNFREDPNIDRGTKKFLEAINKGGPGLETLSKEDARNVLVSAQAAFTVDLSGIDESEKTIQADGHKIDLNIVRPKGLKGKLPVFVFIHGGGWILGDYQTHRRLVRDLVVSSEAVAVFVNYTPSPEAHFPQAINEIYATTKWIAAHGDEINVDGKKLAVAGNSVGGNMSAVMALMAKDKNGPAIRFQLLLWPVTDASFSQHSYRDYGSDRFLTTPVMKWMWDQYTPDLNARKSIYASPLQATTSELKGLPPALVMVAENDILRDEAEAYGRKLDEAGVPVTTIRVNGMIHDFGLLNVLANLPAVQSSLHYAGKELQRHLK
jgi:acetyl esterase/lipase